MAAYVERFVLEGQSARLSAAALETLAIVAYKQPISRVQVSSIRGVDADGVLRTLVQRGFVAEVALPAPPEGPLICGATSSKVDTETVIDSTDLLPEASVACEAASRS